MIHKNEGDLNLDIIIGKLSVQDGFTSKPFMTLKLFLVSRSSSVKPTLTKPKTRFFLDTPNLPRKLFEN